MKKSQKKLMYLSGALVGLGVLKVYLKNKQKQMNVKEYEEDSMKIWPSNENENGFEERKYIKIR